MCGRNNNAVVFVSEKRVSPMEKRLGSEAGQTFRRSNTLELECVLFREYEDRAGRSELRLRRSDSYSPRSTGFREYDDRAGRSELRRSDSYSPRITGSQK